MIEFLAVISVVMMISWPHNYMYNSCVCEVVVIINLVPDPTYLVHKVALS